MTAALECCNFFKLDLNLLNLLLLRKMLQVALDQLQRTAERLMAISNEPEMSIPDAVLSMCDGDELLAFARIPVNEVISISLQLTE